MNALYTYILRLAVNRNLLRQTGECQSQRNTLLALSLGQVGYLHLFTSIDLLFRSSQHMVTILHFCSLSIISGQFMFKWGHLWSNLNFWQPETAADLHCLAILLDNFKTAEFFWFIQRHYGACLCFCNMEFGGHDIQRPTTSSCGALNCKLILTECRSVVFPSAFELRDFLQQIAQ